MKSAAISRLTRVFGIAVIDQIVLSAANFLVGFLLIRHAPDADYGQFVLVQSALILLVSAQSAWVTAPLTVVSLKRSEADRVSMIGAINSSHGRFLWRTAIASMAVPLGMFWLKLADARTCWLVAVAILAGWSALRRDYLRSALLLYRRSNEVFVSDVFYVGVLIAGVAITAYSNVWAALCGSITLVVAGLAGARVAHARFAKQPGWIVGDASAAWRDIRSIGIWSVVGAIFYWLFTQSYNYVIAARLDLASVTAVNAVRLLIMPANVLTIGIMSMLIPQAAAWLAQHGLRKLVIRLLAFLAVIATVELCYFLFVWIARDWLTGDLLHKSFPDRDRLLILWAGVIMVALLRDVVQCALFALGQQKSMAWLIGFSAVVALSVMWFGLSAWGASAALIGQIAGELVNFGGLLAMLYPHLRKEMHKAS